ncbi:substrate-binding periplasmic protein [Kiloniella sp.]|uniref:substrate-binding periplasmic protein n=1 Tax=Kiloniella sp. TaxID=1938587 RepID=UPI003B02B8A5
MHRAFITLVLSLLLINFSCLTFAEDLVLTAHWRDRPPYLTKTADQRYSGILVEILEEAAQKSGFKIAWREVPFARSLQILQRKSPAIVPRMRITEDRALYSNYIGPVAYHRSQIHFLVHKDDLNLIQEFKDLYLYTIGVKRGTVYGKVFDENHDIKRLQSIDDDNMAKMFRAGRFRVMAIADKKAIEEALKRAGHNNYVFSNFVITNGDEGYYYGVPKYSPQTKAYQELNVALLEMLEAGETKRYFEKYGVGEQFWYEQLTPEEVIYSTQ